MCFFACYSGKKSVPLFRLVGAVIGVEVHLLDLAHEGIPGVRAGALVVEGLLHHAVQPGQEVGFVNAVVPDGLFDADFGLQLVDGRDQFFQLLLVRGAAQLQVVGNLGIPRQGVGMVVLGEGTHLRGNLGGVEPQNLVDHQGVGNAVGQMVERAQLVRHGVAHAQEGVGKGHTGHAGGVRHVLTGLGSFPPFS